MRLARPLHALPITGAVACQYALELAPVDLPMAPMATLRIEPQLPIGKHQPEIVPLWDGGIDELLAQGVIGEAFDLPAHSVCRMHALGIIRTKHHQHRPPIALEGLLR